MKKYYLLFLLTTPLLSSVQLPDSLEMETSHIIGSLQETAYAIRDKVQLNKTATVRFNRELLIIIAKLINTQVNPSHIPIIQQALRRYKVVADLCAQERINEVELEKLISLFDQRETIVRAIEETSRPCVYANLIIHNLAQCLGHTPSPLERQSFADQHSKLIASKSKKLTELNEQLFIIEKEILKDRRTWQEKYGSLIKKVCIGLGIATIGCMTINAIHNQLT